LYSAYKPLGLVLSTRFEVIHIVGWKAKCMQVYTVILKEYSQIELDSNNLTAF